MEVSPVRWEGDGKRSYTSVKNRSCDRTKKRMSKASLLHRLRKKRKDQASELSTGKENESEK